MSDDMQEWLNKHRLRVDRIQRDALLNVARMTAAQPCPDGYPNSNIICKCASCTARSVLGSIEPTKGVQL